MSEWALQPTLSGLQGINHDCSRASLRPRHEAGSSYHKDTNDLNKYSSEEGIEYNALEPLTSQTRVEEAKAKRMSAEATLLIKSEPKAYTS